MESLAMGWSIMGRRVSDFVAKNGHLFDSVITAGIARPDKSPVLFPTPPESPPTA